MNYSAEPLAVIIFIMFVLAVLGISYWFAQRAKSASGYFAAGGNIHWSVNGIAFAGDYLSAASFLGIAGMIALYGFDGFLYSIGFLAGWMVALFVVAEPLKRMGKYTFASAIDAKFKSRGVVFAAAVSTLVVSLFYLIPQMVGAGALITPLLGLPFEAGVLIVGSIVILIVATAGMASTTWVQFIKGGLLVLFSLILTVLLLVNGFSTAPGDPDSPLNNLQTLELTNTTPGSLAVADNSFTLLEEFTVNNRTFVKAEHNGLVNYWKLEAADGVLTQAQSIVTSPTGTDMYNGAPKEEGLFFPVGHLSEIEGQVNAETGPVNLFSFFGVIKDSEVIRWGSQKIQDGEATATVYYQVPTQGADILVPGQKFKIDPAKGASTADRVNFVSLMLSLFLGTAALPHILIRYYTVPSPAFARKSTIVAVGAIGLFYLLTFFLGLGAMTSGVIDLTNENMSAPLLARAFGIGIFAIISAIAFATILGTVSGLIVAASGAVAIDLAHKTLKVKMSDNAMVLVGRATAIFVGILAMGLGLAFQHMNVSFLVGWAFTIAASANLPAIIMILFWNRVTAQGVIASIIVGLVGSLTMILLSPDVFTQVYKLPAADAPMPISQPAIISVPLAFLTLVVVSLLTKKKDMLESKV
ncbi:MAG: cation acetate symporter [Dehalogenimonas sp.]|uniref:Cation acetate symporter n=1 Tax=Candidatus Dehalogenimonas loeffleri TaxID=3127115 RepID=A0ABZ2J1A2_9CHLR|nr:cation acetate symporter [Dehalogenimonas sp.]